MNGIVYNLLFYVCKAHNAVRCVITYHRAVIYSSKIHLDPPLSLLYPTLLLLKNYLGGYY